MNKRKFLVVVDPSHERHLALERLLDVIRLPQGLDLGIHLYIGFESDDKSAPDLPEEVVVGREWRRELLQPLLDMDLDFTAEFFWTRNWRKSIVQASRRYQCDTIMIDRSSAENKRGITDSKWDLLRRAKTEVIIVGKDTSGPLKCVLAAVNMETIKEAELNQAILNRGFFLSQFYGAEFHVVNSYKTTEDFPDRDAIQRIVDIPRENIHRDMGKPEDVISQFATQVGADLIIIGNKGRHGLRATLRGNTNEKLLGRLNVDLMVLSSSPDPETPSDEEE